MTKIVSSPEAAYLTSPNILAPGSTAQLTAAVAAARLDIAARIGVTSVSGGSIPAGG